MMPQKPSVYNSPEGTSNLSRDASRFTTSDSTKNDSTTTTADTAPKMTNTERQPQKSMRKPDTVGPVGGARGFPVAPMAGAKPMMRPTRPIARPYSLLGYTDSATTWISGSAMPAPPACSRRDANSSG